MNIKFKHKKKELCSSFRFMTIVCIVKDDIVLNKKQLSRLV
jgi:hypothetical protein